MSQAGPTLILKKACKMLTKNLSFFLNSYFWAVRLEVFGGAGVLALALIGGGRKMAQKRRQPGRKRTRRSSSNAGVTAWTDYEVRYYLLLQQKRDVNFHTTKLGRHVELLRLHVPLPSSHVHVCVVSTATTAKHVSISSTTRAGKVFA